MKLLELFAEELYSFESLHLDLAKYSKGTTLILGKNLDMDSDNGVGKSTLFKLIFLAIYGKDIKGVAYEKIVRVGSSGGSLVSLSFEDANSIFRIVRWKNYKKSKSSVLLCDGKTPSGSGIEFSIDGVALKAQGSSEVAESSIAAKIGMNSKVFLNSIYTQQNKKDVFLEIPDSEKKDLLSKIFDLDFYDKALKSVNSDISVVEKNIDQYKTKLDFLQKNKTDEENNQKNISEQLTKELTKRSLRKSELVKSIAVTKEELAQIKNFISSTGKMDISQLEQNLIKQKSEMSQFKEGQEMELSLTKIIAEHENIVKQLKDHFIRLNEEITAFDIKNNSLIEQLSEIQVNDTTETQRQLDEISIKIKEQDTQLQKINLELKKENALTQNKTTLTMTISELDKKLTQINKDIDELIHNQECVTCHRPFKEGENSLMESLIQSNKTKAQELISQLEQKNTQLQVTLSEVAALEQLKPIKGELEVSQSKITGEFNELKLLQQKELAKIQQANMLKKQQEELTQKNIINLESAVKIKKKEEDTIKYLEQVKPLLEEATIAKQKYQEKLTAVNQLTIELEGFKNQNQSLDVQAKIAADKEGQLFLMENELSDLSTGDVPLKQLLDQSQRQLLSINTELLSLEKSLTTALEQMKYLNFWQTGFSKTGIRSFILDDIINLLNFKTKEYLDILSDRILNLMFQSEHRSKSGTVSNKISTLMYVNGEERVFELNSGGEAQRLNLAVDLALSDIAESRIGTHFNVKFLDEPFNGIDPSGQLKALALFNKLSENRNGFFIISHDKTMQSFGDHKIYLIKENKITRVVDEATFLAAGEKN